jgi:hypothetical protein
MRPISHGLVSVLVWVEPDGLKSDLRIPANSLEELLRERFESPAVRVFVAVVAVLLKPLGRYVTVSSAARKRSLIRCYARSNTGFTG